MALYQNVNGTIKTILSLSENISGTIKTYTSYKQNVNGVVKELLSSKKEILTSGTLIAEWTALGGATISVQDGETVSATVSNSNTNILATNANRIYSNTFYAEAGTELTFNTDGNSPSGPLYAFVIDSSDNATTIGGSGSTATISTTGYYYLVIAGCGVTGTPPNASYGPTSVTNATFTFSGGVAYIEDITT